MTMAAIPETEMPLPAAGAIDQGTTRLAPGITSRALRLAANITALKGVSLGHEGEAVAAGLGNGGLAVFGKRGEPRATFASHHGAVTGLCAQNQTLYSCAQDGRLIRHDVPSGDRTVLFSAPGKWLSALCLAPSSELLAFAAGKSVILLPTAQSPAWAMDHQLTEHPSSVSGLAFSPDGKRLAVSHYDGVTLWPLEDTATGGGELLRWKGSHIGVSWSPDGRFVVSATQERELHVWDLVTGKDFRLGGYPAKTHALKWTSAASGPVHLVCSGADVVTAWPFGDVGPGRLPPVEIGYVYSGRVTAVAPHPTKALVAGGYTTGTVLVGGLQKGEAVFARTADGEEIASLDWIGESGVLAVGTRQGGLDLIDVGGLKVS